MEYYSPAFSVTSDMTDEELDKYFETYVPLSRLPTPPPAKDHAIPRAASTSTTASAPELTGTCSYFLFFGIPFAMSYFPHQAFLRLRCDNVVHGPLHEGRKALSHVIPTPLPISPLHCFLLHCSWQSISTSPLLIQLYLLDGKFDTSMFVMTNISKLSLRNTSRKPSPVLHTAPTTRRCRIGLSRPRKSA
jgi:hypothetical protein